MYGHECRTATVSAVIPSVVAVVVAIVVSPATISICIKAHVRDLLLTAHPGQKEAIDAVCKVSIPATCIWAWVVGVLDMRGDQGQSHGALMSMDVTKILALYPDPW